MNTSNPMRKFNAEPAWGRLNSLSIKHAAARTGARQRGAVLVMALVILLVMTILGVTVMNTASLESTMAGNTQETNRAFHAAESGLEHSMTDGSVFSTMINPGDSNAPTGVTYTFGSSPATATVVTTYDARGETSKRTPDRSKVNSSTLFGTANFKLVSTGRTTLLAQSEVKQGVSQVTPK